MGLNRYFMITAETRKREAIYDPALAKKAFDAIDSRYGGWTGGLEDRDAMIIDGVNWYDVDDDMKAVSRELPELIFCVYCEGMGLDDIWTEYYCAGRHSGGSAEIPEPDYDYLLTGKHTMKREPVVLSDEDYDLIEEALACLAQSGEDEMKWVGDDHDILTANEARIRRIDALHAKLFGE